jgi:galactitol-specific phosphotransferase system IIB component
MAKKYLIFTACGYNITSTTVAMKIKKVMGERGYDVEARTMRALEAPMQVPIHKPDLCVFTATPPKGLPCPSVQGTSLLSGIGAEETYNEIQAIFDAPHWAGKDREVGA